MDKSILDQSKINSLFTFLIYPKKLIPNSAVLYRAIHFNNISETTFRPSASTFKDTELSCDWNRYSTPEQSRNLISKQYKFGSQDFKNCRDYFISGIYVVDNLDLDPVQTFLHDPLYHFPPKKGSPNNRAHSLIKGNKEEKEAVKARKQLANRCKWEIFNKEEFLELKK